MNNQDLIYYRKKGAWYAEHPKETGEVWYNYIMEIMSTNSRDIADSKYSKKRREINNLKID